MFCCCSLAGTIACKTCHNNSFIKIETPKIFNYINTQQWDTYMKPEIIDKISKINEIYPVSKEELRRAMKKCKMI